MIHRIPRYLSIVALLLMSHTAAGEEAETRQFALPGHGSLQLDVPKSWRSRITRRRTPPALDVLFVSPRDARFQVQMTVVEVQPTGSAEFDSARLKKIVAQSAKKLKFRTVETEITIQALRGPSAAGYYFSVTDRAPGPNGIKYMTHGLARVGPLMLFFTTQKIEGDATVAANTIAMVRSGIYRKVGSPDLTAGSRPAARPDAIRITKRRNGYVLSVPVSRLVMTLPQGTLVRKSGVSRHPRYFYFEDSADGLIVSGWFEPAKNFRNIRRFWAEQTKAWRQDNLPTPRNVSFGKVGKWNVIFYDIDIANGTTQSHLRAHWIQDGTWIDMHLSLVSDRPSKALRAKLAERLKTFTVARKK